MALNASTTLPYSVAQVTDTFTSEAFLRHISELVGGTLVSADLDGSVDGAFNLTVVRKLPTTRLPEIARKVVGESLTVTQTERWQAPAADGSRTADLEVKVAGAPVDAKAVQQLVADCTSTRVELRAKSPPAFRSWVARSPPPPSRCWPRRSTCRQPRPRPGSPASPKRTRHSAAARGPGLDPDPGRYLEPVCLAAIVPPRLEGPAGTRRTRRCHPVPDGEFHARHHVHDLRYRHLGNRRPEPGFLRLGHSHSVGFAAAAGPSMPHSGALMSQRFPNPLPCCHGVETGRAWPRTGHALAVQGAELLLRRGTPVIPLGMQDGLAAFVVCGCAVTATQLSRRTPMVAAWAAHLAAGASMLVLYVVLVVGIGPVMWVLNASGLLVAHTSRPCRGCLAAWSASRPALGSPDSRSSCSRPRWSRC